MTHFELIDDKAMDEALSLLSRELTGRKAIEHFNARTIDDAVSLMSEFKVKAKIIAGGVDLVSLMKYRMVAPEALVNIKTIPDLAYINEDADGLKIGALATVREMAVSAFIREKYPMLAEAARSVAAPQLRNMITIGGNLCQDVRCWYYRRPPLTGTTFFCRRKGGEHCFAVNGENAFHAIFAAGECHAVCPSDMAPALIALQAALKISSPKGERIVPLEHFYLPIGNMLEPDEIITEIQVPSVAPDTRQRFLKSRIRKTIDFAISSAAAAITLKSGVVADARIVLGSVAPTPYRALRAEEILKGGVLTENLAAAAAEAAVKDARPLSKNAYKVPITEALVKRAIWCQS